MSKENLNAVIEALKNAEKELNVLESKMAENKNSLSEYNAKLYELRRTAIILEGLKEEYVNKRIAGERKLTEITNANNDKIKELADIISPITLDIKDALKLGEKKLIVPETFTELGKLEDEERKKAVEAINEMIKSYNESVDNSDKSKGISSYGNTKKLDKNIKNKIEVNNLDEYFKKSKEAKTDKDKRKSAEVKRIIKDLIKEGNKANEKLNKAIDKQKEEISNVTEKDKYIKQLQAIGKAFGEKQEEERKALSRKVFFQRGESAILSFGNEKLDKLSKLVGEGVAMFAVASIKGELTEKEQKIKEFEDKIKNNIQIRNAIDRGEAYSYNNTMLSGTEHTDATRISLTKLADRRNKRDILEKDTEEARKNLAKLRKEAEEIKEKTIPETNRAIAEIFGEVSGEKIDVKPLEIRSEIERKVIENIGTNFEKELEKQTIDRLSRESYLEEADLKKSDAQIAEGIKIIDEYSTNLSDYFTESSLSKIDTIADGFVKIVEVGSKIYGKFSGEDKRYEKEESIDIGKELDGVKGKINDLVSEMKGEEKSREHYAEKVIEIAKGCNEFLKIVSGKVGEMSDMAKFRLDGNVILLEEYNNIKEITQKANLFTNEKGKQKEIPKELQSTALNATVNYLINTGETAKKFAQNGISKAEETIKITEEELQKCKKEIEPIKEKTESLNSEIEKNKSEIAEKENKIFELQEAVHRERQNIVRENANSLTEPIKVKSDEINSSQMSGIKALSYITGVELSENGDLMKAVEKIYINGLSAKQYFQLDDFKNQPDMLKSKIEQMGERLKDILGSTAKNQPNKDNPLYGQIISVENDNFLLRPIILENAEFGNTEKPQKPIEPQKPEPLSGFGNRKKNRENMEIYNSQMEQYRENIEKYNSDMESYKAKKEFADFNENSKKICSDFNQTRVLAASAEYDKNKIKRMTAEQQNENVKKITLDEAVRKSRGEERKTTVTKALEHKTLSFEKSGKTK